MILGGHLKLALNIDNINITALLPMCLPILINLLQLFDLAIDFSAIRICLPQSRQLPKISQIVDTDLTILHTYILSSLMTHLCSAMPLWACASGIDR